MSRGLPDTVVVGRIVKPHGLRGDVVVEVATDVEGRFDPGSALDLEGQESPLVVDRCRLHKGALLVAFEGRVSRDAAEALRGRELTVARESVPPAPAGSYYYFELVGCMCSDVHEGELGLVREIIEDGGGLILEIESDGKLLLVPFVSDFLRSVDVESATIELDLPPGLVETCASK
ncbi:MAG: ribosome maturation factor RimM [Acidobacteriota bacterium]|nr:ribosome maturation factor RimM [Acidobacteriota bacterium]